MIEFRINGKQVSSIFVSIASAALLTTGAMAAGGGSDDTSTTTTKQCEAGKVWDKQKNDCVPKTSLLDQESLFEAGRSLAYNGNYKGAIELLSAVPNRTDARVLNMLGYANRKLGNREQAIAYYKHSMAVDPSYALVREYYGKALLEEGDVHAARNQLSIIGKLCGEDCEIYGQLHTAIEAHVAGLPRSELPAARW